MSSPETHKTTVNFISLGCPKNLVDSEHMLGLLGKDNFHINPPDAPSHVTVINTCSFVEDSKKESINTILEIAERKKTGDCNLLVVTGCLSQRYVKELPHLLPEVDLFIGTGEFYKLPQLIKQKLAGKKILTRVKEPKYLPDHLTPRAQTTPFYTKYVKIAEGCSHRCSFCIIPHIRGVLRSRTPEDIFSEITTGLQNGVKEFNLVSQDLNEYGRDLTDRTSLYKLLAKLENLDHEFWIRLMYMYPLQFPYRLVELIAAHPHIAKYVDIPLQHITDRMLKIMNRGSSAKYIYKLLEQLKTRIPDMVLRTTFIVGHPGETASDFEALKGFVQHMEFDRVGVFKYSDEEDTPSFTLQDKVPQNIKQDRHDELMALQQKISLKKNKQLIGKRLRTLLEGPAEETDLLLQGRYFGQAPDIDGVVLIRDGSAPVGTLCDVKIVDAFEYDLLGEIIPT